MSKVFDFEPQIPKSNREMTFSAAPFFGHLSNPLLLFHSICLMSHILIEWDKRQLDSK